MVVEESHLKKYVSSEYVSTTVLYVYIRNTLYLYSISETSDRTKDNINVCQSSTSTSESNTDSSVTVSEATVLLRT